MNFALVVLCVLQAAPQEENPKEGFDPLGWARALDRTDLAWTLGGIDFELSGELDLEAYACGREAPGMTLEQSAMRARHYDNTKTVDTPAVGGRLVAFLDGAYSDWFAMSVELRGDRANPADPGGDFGARFEQYWMRFTLPGRTWLNLQVGKFSAPVGNFIPRNLPGDNPLTTWPIAYDWVTSFMYKADTPTIVLNRRDKADVKFWRVPIWEEDYGTGAMAFGGSGAVTYAFAVTNSAPATWGWNWSLHTGDFRSPNLYGRVTVQPDISMKFGASVARGPFDRADANAIPAGRNTGDFPQTLAGVDVWWSRGHLELFGEAYWTRFTTPLVDDLNLVTWYVEAKYTFTPGLFGALRFGQIYFGDIRSVAGEQTQWDRNGTRVEAGGGYFFTKKFFVKGTVQINENSGGREPNDNLVMMQVVVGI